MKRFLVVLLLSAAVFSAAVFSASAQVYGPSFHGNSFGSRHSSVSAGTTKGYRGMVETSHGIDIEAYYVNQLITVHGYQFNPHIFLGGYAGIGSEICENDPYMFFDVGADFRAYFLDRKITPFAGARVGFVYIWDSYEDIPSASCSLQIGVRHGLRNKLGLNYGIVIGGAVFADFCDFRLNIGFEF